MPHRIPRLLAAANPTFSPASINWRPVAAAISATAGQLPSGSGYAVFTTTTRTGTSCKFKLFKHPIVVGASR